jgi:hypothetical protein
MSTSQFFNNAGIAQMMQAYFNNSFAANKNLTLKLFCNNVTPLDTDTTATYTEASGSGYAAVTLLNGSWVVSQVGGIEQSAYALQTFTFTGPLTTNPTIYGYYIIDNAVSPNVITAQLLNAPSTPVNNGDILKVTPLIQGSHGTPTS